MRERPEGHDAFDEMMSRPRPVAPEPQAKPVTVTEWGVRDGDGLTRTPLTEKGARAWIKTDRQIGLMGSVLISREVTTTRTEWAEVSDDQT